MTSVHKINETLAQLRGSPTATIEAYSRKLRSEGILPATKRGGAATQITSTHVARMLFAVMRGSTSTAAENAREIGDLIVDDGGALMEPILKRQLAALDWPENMSFAEAVAWLIDGYRDETIHRYLAKEKNSIKVNISRYWPRASISWRPTKEISGEYISAMDDVFPGIGKSIMTNLMGELIDPMEISFNSPWRYEMKASYGVDKDRNREAWLRWTERFEGAETWDVHGDEYVTQRTLIALSKHFKEERDRNKPRGDSLVGAASHES